ncbi:MAG: molybdopterin molybdenumtransferase MoeA, partial [Saprospiraceae bacterium]
MRSNHFVTVKIAQDSIFKKVSRGEIVEIKTRDAHGYVLAESIKSPDHSPPFNQSAMDGYAFCFESVIHRQQLTVIGESAAGKNFNGKVKRGQAVRIFTGACIPYGADTVVMQERINIENNLLMIHDDQLKHGSNIRLKGSQTKNGALAVSKRTFLNAGVIGYIASLGIDTVKVYRKPVISII